MPVMFLFYRMKTYFTGLFNYDKYANEAILNVIMEANQPEKAIQLMAHILGANRVWLNRCLGLPHVVVDLWITPDKSVTNFSETIKENHIGWMNYLSDLNDADFEKKIDYKNMKGDSFNDKLTDILTHVINHGTHHRAQIGQQLKLVGVDRLPITDYIAYLRQ